jgi:hypothetical protein
MTGALANDLIAYTATCKGPNACDPVLYIGYPNASDMRQVPSIPRPVSHSASNRKRPGLDNLSHIKAGGPKKRSDFSCQKSDKLPQQPHEGSRTGRELGELAPQMKRRWLGAPAEHLLAMMLPQIRAA